MTPETIYALSSGRGRAGIAVIRISGPAAADTVRDLSGRAPVDRRALRVDLRDPASGEVLDDAICLFFAAPRSFTGEDVAELHVHGGTAVIQGVLAVLGKDAGLRMADPGEFTRRAFENGRMDLTAAESIGDLINAETAQQRRQALRQGGGALAELCDAWRERLVAALAHWEAAIDFSDEELPADLEARTVAEVADLRAEIDARLANGRAGERLRDGVHLAIIGPPNAGKSSLLNLLAKRDVAIVSETAGTTRDVLEVHLDLGGYPVIAVDTAGLRDSDEPVEREGVRRARQRAKGADLRLLIFDAETWPAEAATFADVIDAETIVAVNKIDLTDPDLNLAPGGGAALGISVHTGAGIDELLDRLEARVAGGFETSAAPVVTRARHREALEDGAAALAAFLARDDRLGHPEIAGEDLRLAGRAMGRITGRFDVEDLLDVIFQDFCIGK